MPLNLPGLQEAIADIGADPPATVPECAQAWADAVGSYASGIIPASTTVEVAKGALAGALTTAFGSPAAAPGMEAAFAAFAAAVGLGMAGFTPAPPVTPVGFAAQFAGPKPETHAEAGQQIGQLINDWLTTGSSTLIAPPFTVVPWS
jgi:hypothetical protein